MGVPNVDGTCWMSSLLTVLLHSDGLSAHVLPRLLSDAAGAVSRSSTSLSKLRAMLLHTAAQRYNTNDVVQFVDPTEIIALLYRINKLTFPMRPLSSCGGNPLVYMCALLGLVGVGCATYIVGAFSDGTECVMEARPSGVRSISYSHSAATLDFCHKHPSLGDQLRRLLEHKASATANSTNQAVAYPDVVALQASSDRVRKSNSRLRRGAHASAASSASQKGDEFLPLYIPCSDGVEYALDAVIVMFPRHSVSGVTLGGKEHLHENQAQEQRFQLVDAKGSPLKRRSYLFGCPYVRLNWKDALSRRVASCEGRTEHEDDKCGFSFRPSEPSRIKFFCSSPSSRQKDSVYVYAKRAITRRRDRGIAIENASPARTIAGNAVLPRGVKTLVIHKERSEKRRREATYRMFSSGAP